MPLFATHPWTAAWLGPRSLRLFWVLTLGLLLLLPDVHGQAERIPPPPPRYFNDFANVVPRGTADQLNARLEQTERETSNQLLVVVYPRMESSSSIEDYTVRVAQRWGAGQKDRDNGAILFVFVQDRQLFLQVGYGLEGALPDALAFQIIENEIKPRFRTGDYAGGLSAGVEAMIAATQGEYKGTGRTLADRSGSRGGSAPFPFVGLIIFLFILFSVVNQVRGRRHTLGSPGRLSRRPGMWLGPPPGGGFGGGFGGGGGFRGGGGGFGGGGAGGRW